MRTSIVSLVGSSTKPCVCLEWSLHVQMHVQERNAVVEPHVQREKHAMVEPYVREMHAHAVVEPLMDCLHT